MEEVREREKLWMTIGQMMVLLTEIWKSGKFGAEKCSIFLSELF